MEILKEKKAFFPQAMEMGALNLIDEQIDLLVCQHLQQDLSQRGLLDQKTNWKRSGVEI